MCDIAQEYCIESKMRSGMDHRYGNTNSNTLHGQLNKLNRLLDTACRNSFAQRIAGSTTVKRSKLPFVGVGHSTNYSSKMPAVLKVCRPIRVVRV